MREEDIIDALDGIDEELIAQADEARKNKVKKKNRIIKGLAAVAAVFMVSVLTFTAVAIIRSNSGTDGLTNSSTGGFNNWSDGDKDGINSGLTNTGNNGDDGERGEILNMRTVTLKVTGWYDEGSCFMGQVTDTLDSKMLSNGMYIEIRFGESGVIVMGEDGKIIQLASRPIEAIIPVESEITVKYSTLIPPVVTNGEAGNPEPTRGDHFIMVADTVVLDRIPDAD